MAKAIPMKKIWEARDLIRLGYSVKEVSTSLKISEGVVRSYTKSERAIMKERR